MTIENFPRIGLVKTENGRTKIITGFKEETIGINCLKFCYLNIIKY